MSTQKLKILDLFSGIGGFSYAAERIVGGFETKQFVEIDSYCQSVLHKNFPNVPIHDDIKTFTGKPGQFDVFTAGFPCQDLSVAGRQKGIGEGTRSGLFYEIIRLLGEIQPRFVLFENVRNLLSHEKGATFQEILFQIAKAGYDAEWSVISAKDVGACHKRERLWIIAYPNSNRVQSRLQRGISREWEILSEESKRSEMGSEVERCSQTSTNSTAMDHLPQRGFESMVKQTQVHRKGRTKLANLREAVNPEAVKLFNDLQKSNGNIEKINSTQTGNDIYLNPHFVEEMMGYPIGYCV